MPRVAFPSLKGQVAIITGASRGIGRECALSLSKAGAKVAIVAKTTEAHPTLPGTIYTVAEEVIKQGGSALPIKADLRKEEEINAAVDKVVKEWGRIDILVNNASALWWQDIVDTPMNKYDLITSINVRGTFCMTKACLPHMAKNNHGRVITMSPPINLHSFAGRTAYNVSKFGMTMVALGVSAEYKGKGICGYSLWPATVVESQASKNFKLGDPSTWRKATVLSDATLMLCGEPDDFTGQMLIDDDYLRARGWEDADFVQYRVDPNVEPPRLLAAAESGLVPAESRAAFKRGDVRELKRDLAQSKI